MATAQSVTLSGPSGVRIYGGKFDPGGGGVLSGSVALADVVASGALVGDVPLPTGNIVQFLTSDGGTEAFSSNFSGPTKDYWHKRLGFGWKRNYISPNPLHGRGNWLDAAQVDDGPTAYASTSAVSAVGQVLTANVTTLVQRWRSNGLNRGFYLNTRVSAWPVGIHGRGAVASGDRPTLTVNTTVGGPFVLTAEANASWASTSFSSAPGKTQFTVAADSQPAIVRFDLSTVTGTVTSATLTMKVAALPGSAGQIVDVFEADPPTIFDPVTVASPELGLLNGYADFNAFKSASLPGVKLFADDFESPGPFDTGFVPAATRTLNPSTGTTYATGTISGGGAPGSGTPSADINKSVSVGVGATGTPDVVYDELHGHYRFRLKSNFGTTADTAVKIPAMGVQFGYWNPAGYWQQTTGNGGNPGTGLKLFPAEHAGALAAGKAEYQGHSVRFLTGTEPRAGDDDPYRGWFGIGIYPYNLDQGGPFPPGEPFPWIAIRKESWYDVDIRVKQNTMSGAQDGLGNYATANPDGIYQVRFNGHLAYSRTNFRWRRHAEFGVQGVWVDVYHGGNEPQPYSVNYDLDQVVIATTYIGPKAASVPAPTGSKPLPVFQAAKSYDNGIAFTTTLGSADVGEQFNVGTGPSTGVIARVVASNHAATIDSFAIGGVALTPLAQTALAGWSANERVFYGVGLSLTGLQAWTATVNAGAKIMVQIFAAHSAVSFSAEPPLSVLNSTLSQALTPDPNTIAVGMLTSNADTGVLTAKSGSMLRELTARNFYKSLILTEDYQSDPSMDAVVTGGDFTYSYLGRICYLKGNVPAALSWMPAAGSIATLSVANGLLTNSFVSQCTPWFGAFWYVKTSATYGVVTKNPYYGDYGCTVYYGGGDANTNDNTVTIAEYGPAGVTFKRAVDGSPYFGLGTDATTQGNNSVGNTNAVMDYVPAGGPGYMEYGETKYMLAGLEAYAGQPGAPHMYGITSVIPPAFGGAAHGTLHTTAMPAINHAFYTGTICAHALAFGATTTPSSALKWTRDSNERQTGSASWAAPMLCEFVPMFGGRTYQFANSSVSLMRWYDHTSKTYVTGTGATMPYDSADGFDSGAIFYVPSRGLLVIAVPRGGVMNFDWLDVTVAQPSFGGAGGGTAVLSSAPAVNLPWGAATWCPESHRVIAAGVVGDNTGVYELEIPADPRSTWTVTRAPLLGGTIPSMATAAEFKRFGYDGALKAIFYFGGARTDGADVAHVLKPRNT